MYICLCEGVSDGEIKAAIADGACSPAEVMRCTRAGTRCGSCRPAITAIVRGADAEPASSRRHLSMVSSAA
jgi:bacterioferritin-associated ferredoxin